MWICLLFNVSPKLCSGYLAYTNNNGNWTEWSSSWSEIVGVILPSMISDQNFNYQLKNREHLTGGLGRKGVYGADKTRRRQKLLMRSHFLQSFLLSRIWKRYLIILLNFETQNRWEFVCGHLFLGPGRKRNTEHEWNTNSIRPKDRHYSETPLIRPPTGQRNLAVSTG